MSNRPFNLFISYAHASESHKERLRTHLAPLQAKGLIELWQDREIPAGSEWRGEIGVAMDAADGAIFLVCADFLGSKFCREVEVEHFLQRYRDEQVLILFVLADHCLWEEVEYLRRFQLVPRDGQPIVAFDPPSMAYTNVAREIRDAVENI